MPNEKAQLAVSPTELPSYLPARAVQLAADILNTSRARETSLDRSRSAQMARMMRDESGKKFTIVMADQVLKIPQPHFAARRLANIVRQYGLPQYFQGLDKIGLQIGSMLAQWLPQWIMPAITKQVRRQSQHVIISAEPESFKKYLAQRQADGMRVNFNHLGEAVLGDKEANHRWEKYIERLKHSEVTYFSVKLSSIVSQISLTGYQQTLELLKPRLRELYRAALKNDSGKPKFVNLDMEEYRDLHLTVDVFTQVLDEPEFDRLEAGIVLQAYLPDSFAVQHTLTAWALSRHARTGTGIKIRLVKGANLAMEQVEAALRDWEQAPYYSKPEVDANFKRMLEFGSRPEHARVVRLGIASHNLFDVAYALLVREERGIADRIEFEMLEGMANAQALEVQSRAGGLTVYTPAVHDTEFEAAVAYLVRRLDENTAPGSFLGALFGLKAGSPTWEAQRRAFAQACQLARDPNLSSSPNRKQNRLTEKPTSKPVHVPFRNQPDTDFSLPTNRQWIAELVKRWQQKTLEPIGLEIGGKSIPREFSGVGRDPSRPGVEAYRYAQANSEDVDEALRIAVLAQPKWEGQGITARGIILREVAAQFARERGDTIGAMMIDAGKTMTEADVEISEAIDFANYYSHALDDRAWFDGTDMKARGVVVVTPPWNFPYAIPAGGVLAALMAGNTVILKPSRETVLTAWMLAQQLWRGGVPRDVLQFLPIGDRGAGKSLITDSRTAAVILTGSYETARNFQSWRPDLALFAETSGKNSMVVTVNADLDLAIKDMVRGAFGHSGQKCSATSLALLERPVYESEKFRATLKDAAQSLIVGGSWNPSATATPVVREPDENLRRGLTTLDPGEEWLLEPKMVDNNPCLWSPGIKLGVKPGSWYHRTECFGPVLGLMCVENFDEAIAIQNSNEFGLTGGLHSLEPLEIAKWREQVEVGNAYINRGMTGAIVQRQPFGGWKNSCVGPGSKAGGPNYVASLANWHTLQPPSLRMSPRYEWFDLQRDLQSVLGERDSKAALAAAAESYAYHWEHHFSIEHDPSQIHGESNHFRYRARPWHVLRLAQTESSEAALDAAMTIMACRIAGTKLRISMPSRPQWLARMSAIPGIEPGKVNHGVDFVIETHAELVKYLAEVRSGSVRLLGASDDEQLRPEEIGNLAVFFHPPVSNGRLELLTYLREQSISQTLHRYGNII